jgi:hypothetical protein
MFSLKMNCAHLRRGHVSALMAVSLIAVIGFGALTLDGGVQYHSRRKVQAAADAAVLAAAIDLYNNYATNSGTDPNGTAKHTALTTATALGYPNSGNSTVTVNIPPLSGLYAGQTGYAEVIIGSNQSSYFSALWGNKTLSMSARAVARGKKIAGNQGIIILDPTISDSLEIDGKLTILNSGSIIVDSTDPAAVQFSNVANLVAGQIEVVGTPGVTITKGGVNGATVVTGITPVSDPLAAIPEPNPATQTYYGNVTVNATTTLQPGAYSKMTVGNNINVTMAPGVYTFGYNGAGKNPGGGGLQVGIPECGTDQSHGPDVGTVYRDQFLPASERYSRDPSPELQHAHDVGNLLRPDRGVRFPAERDCRIQHGPVHLRSDGGLPGRQWDG